MTNEELIVKIKAEFERRIKILREDKVVRQNCTSNFLEGKIYGYEEVLSFLSAFKSEKPMNQDELEKEISRFRTIFQNECDHRVINEVACHFAKWGIEHFTDACKTSTNDLIEAAESEEDRIIEEVEKDDRGCPYISSTHVYNAFIRGAKWHKKQMMDDAVEAFVATHLTSEGTKVTVNSGYLPKEFGIKNGDNVRIIIVKE